jgi:hypothetical protein
MRKSLLVVLISVACVVSAQAQMVAGFTVRSHAVMPLNPLTTTDSLLVNKFSAWEGAIETLTVGGQFGLGMTVFGSTEIWSNRGLRVHGPIASDWTVANEDSLASDGTKVIALPEGWAKTPGAKYTVHVTPYRHRGEKDGPLNVERYADHFVVWSSGSPCDFSYSVTLAIPTTK